MLDLDILVELRTEKVDDLGPWLWTRTDRGAWDGPKQDWENSHKNQVLQHITNRRVVVQAGGNQGMYPCLLKHHFEKVYTFEPDYLNFYCLVQNCQDENIYKFQSFLGETHGMFNVNRCTMNNTGMHTLGTGGGAIPMLMLDDFHFDILDFIWLDIECSEIRALQGGLKTIEQHRPVIMCENANSNIDEFLKKFGYQRVVQSVSDTIYKVIL